MTSDFIYPDVNKTLMKCCVEANILIISYERQKTWKDVNYCVFIIS